MSSDDELHGIIKRAMALRVKYRVEYKKRKLPLALLGVHPRNRSGVYPNADRVESLGMALLKDGFNVEEAEHEGVCVQEVPMAERSAYPAVAGYSEFNVANCVDPRLKVCFEEQPGTSYGTLSHSHLLMVLLSFTNGAKWNVPQEFRGLLNEDGGWDFSAVAAKDPALGQLCKEGLSMEVLSWKLYAEEPDACSLISQALNRGHAHALKTTEITAMAALAGACAKELESSVAGKIVFETVQRKVRNELAEYADDPEFIDLFDFVVNVGVMDAPFMPHLLEFAKHFVDSKKRQVRLQAFAIANKIPNACPWTKIAVIMRCYRQKPLRTWCPCPEPLWAHVDAEKLNKMEQLMHYFHNTLSSAVAGMAYHDRLALLANVACLVADAFVKYRDNAQLPAKLCQTAAPFYDKVVAHCGSMTPRVDVPSPQSDWIKFTSVEVKQADHKQQQQVESDELTRLLPKVIQFDPATGKPMNVQEARNKKIKKKNGRRRDRQFRRTDAKSHGGSGLEV